MTQNQIYKRLKKRKIVSTKNWDEWVSASSTRNYMIKDPLLDFLSFHSLTLANKKSYAPHISKAKAPKISNFTEFIMAQGNEFESKVMDHLYKKHRGLILDIGGNYDARSEDKAQDTLNAMNKGVPFIYQGVLHNSDNKTYGVPDLIVRSDWLKELVLKPVLTENYETMAAPLLSTPFGNQMPNYHYCIVDIKFTTLKLRADGIHILNSGSIPAFKSQLYIYNMALGKLQGYTPHHSYILGRKWAYTCKGKKYKGNSCLDRLGVINYDEIDTDIPGKTHAALEWIRDMRLNGSNWDLSILPLPRKELYPNMSNSCDYPWHEVKKVLANEIGEITSLWMCGVKNRDLAHSYGVYNWRDESCTPFILGIHGEKTSRILKEILYTNRVSENLVNPAKIENNDMNWQNSKFEMYVDFEFVNDVVCDFNKMPQVDAEAVIFMIGVGYFIDKLDDTGVNQHKWIYREFTSDYLTVKEEERICNEFSMYVKSEAHFYDCDQPLLIHWSNAEKWQWDKAFDRHNGKDKMWIPSSDSIVPGPQWFDMLQVFKAEPITIKGCMGFGLKEVARTLSNHGFFDFEWDMESPCTDGAGAMIGAFKASKDAKNRGLVLKDMPLIRDIIKYNEADCLMTGKVVEYIRNFHTDYVQEAFDEVVVW